jgi:hypothetical protein
MARNFTHITALTLALLLAGCATQQTSQFPGQLPSPAAPTVVVQASSAEQTMLRTLVNYQDRLYRVAGPILTSNPELCKGNNARNLFGFTAKNKYSWSPDLADAASSAFGLDDRLQVVGVLPGSGADRAGLKRGDKLISVEGRAMPTGQNAERQAAGILAPMVGKKPAVNLIVERGDSGPMPINVKLTRACAYSVELGNADHINAYSDGRRVMVTRGLMNFAQSDDELALVLAKEMAHNSLMHPAKLKNSAAEADVIDNLLRIKPDLSNMAGTGGIRATPQEMDAAADVLALYMVARAGYRYDDAARFWQRLTSEQPASVLNGYTHNHPGTAYRIGVIEKIIPEIKAKQASKQPLFP